MHCGLIVSIYMGLNYMAGALSFTQTLQQKTQPEDYPAAWYHFPAQSQTPPPFIPTNVSPYGPRISTNGDSFVPVPSPFQITRPKTPQEIAASQIVNAAQEVCLVFCWVLSSGGLFRVWGLF
jgi:hypothetical protein